MRMLWLVLVERFGAAVADIAYRLSAGYRTECWERNGLWARLYFWGRIVSYWADVERGYRRAGLWPPRGASDA